MQENVLPTTWHVVETSQFVTIDKVRLEEVAGSLDIKGRSVLESDDYCPPSLSLEDVISLTCLFNCLNFCFWAGKDEHKWAIEIDGASYDGGEALYKALFRALHSKPLLSGSYLAQISADDLAEILKGNGGIPLFLERLAIVRNAGQTLQNNFGGKFIHLFESADNDAVRLANLCISALPGFDDSIFTDGIKVEFHKRAQVNAAMVHAALITKGEPGLLSLDKLTAFADYKVPQILRKLGILKYHDDLVDKVDAYIEITAGSREEVEIRANTIWAVEEMKRALKSRFPEVTATVIDHTLWEMSQVKRVGDTPYHRTRTIFY